MTTISVDQAAVKLSISPQAVRSLCDRGLLVGTREPFGPGWKWVISAASVAKRKRQMRENRLPKGGRPRKSNGDKDLKNLAKSGATIR
jgi:hypothetical protein